MKKQKYEVTGFDWIGVERLEPHPAAAMPIQAEDSQALLNSMAEGGMIQPLLVLEEPEDGAFWVVDGCNRLSAAKEIGGLLKLPCVKIRCADVRAVALECLAIGRKRSTGQRILAYLELHKPQVLAAADANAGEGSLRSRDRRENIGDFENFSAEKIAERLVASDKDVRLAIELLRCKERKLGLPMRVGALVYAPEPLDMDTQEGKDFFRALEKTYAGILSGGTPVRRWKAALGGLANTQNGRPETNYKDVMKNGLKGVALASKNWDKVPYTFRPMLIELFQEMWAALPAELKNTLEA